MGEESSVFPPDGEKSGRAGRQDRQFSESEGRGFRSTEGRLSHFALDPGDAQPPPGVAWTPHSHFPRLLLPLNHHPER